MFHTCRLPPTLEHLDYWSLFASSEEHGRSLGLQVEQWPAGLRSLTLHGLDLVDDVSALRPTVATLMAAPPDCRIKLALSFYNHYPFHAPDPNQPVVASALDMLRPLAQQGRLDVLRLHPDECAFGSAAEQLAASGLVGFEQVQVQVAVMGPNILRANEATYAGVETALARLASLAERAPQLVYELWVDESWEDGLQVLLESMSAVLASGGKLPPILLGDDDMHNSRSSLEDWAGDFPQCLGHFEVGAFRWPAEGPQRSGRVTA